MAEILVRLRTVIVRKDGPRAKGGIVIGLTVSTLRSDPRPPEDQSDQEVLVIHYCDETVERLNVLNPRFTWYMRLPVGGAARNIIVRFVGCGRPSIYCDCYCDSSFKLQASSYTNSFGDMTTYAPC